MTLGKCKECNKEVSKSAKICPHCGAQHPAVPTEIQVIAQVIGLAVAGFFLWAIYVFYQKWKLGLSMVF